VPPHWPLPATPRSEQTVFSNCACYLGSAKVLKSGEKKYMFSQLWNGRQIHGLGGEQVVARAQSAETKITFCQTMNTS
jgi:hypothetical protein